MYRQPIYKYSPTPGDVHVNTPLTNISIAILQSLDNFIAARVFPNIPVTFQSDRYYTYDRGEFNRDEMRKRAPGTESAGGSYKIDNTPSYYCELYAIHKDIPDQLRATADSVLTPEREATEYLTRKAAIKREKLWASKFFTTGVWSGGDPAYDWSPGGADDPIVNIRTERRNRLESTGYEPNTLVVGRSVWDTLADNADVIDRVKYGQTPVGPAMGTMMALRELFGVERIFVMNAIENTAKEGQTAVHSFIGGDSALLCYSAPSPGIMTPSAGYTFSWTGYLGAGAEGNRISRFREERLKSDRIEIEMAFDQKLIAADLGVFMQITV